MTFRIIALLQLAGKCAMTMIISKVLDVNVKELEASKSFKCSKYSICITNFIQVDLNCLKKDFLFIAGTSSAVENHKLLGI